VKKLTATTLFLLLFTIWLTACSGTAQPTNTPTSPPPTNLPPANTQVPVSTEARPPATDTLPPPTATNLRSTDTQAPATEAQPVSTDTPQSGPVKGLIPRYPAPPPGIPASLPAAQPLGGMVAFAWNNLGMHCYQSDYSQFLILPPYNVFWTQVIARGDDPSIVTSGITANYSLPQVTRPAEHTNFWDFAAAYGWKLAAGTGLTGKGITGTLDAQGDHFIAEGVPVVDFIDDGTWDPYPFFVVQVQNGSGQTVAETVNVAPASTEMSCFLCHGGDTMQAVFMNILNAHDKNEGTGFAKQAQNGQPVLCNTCHADPAMGVMDNHNSTTTLSGAMHTFHADKMAGSQLPPDVCQACHPGPQSQCLRDVMAANGIVCQDCHGDMTAVGSVDRTPWVNLPRCESCHTQQLVKATSTHIDNPNQSLTASADQLYRNRKAHGGGGIYCAACHGSPHAIYPTITERDNQQSIRLQGHAGPINECSVCHIEHPDESFWHVGGGD
jgi:hypothetical protein